ncbi:hypothetical protein [Arthrobacter sp. PsM3]|uniref:hypothetical protein n=1 Tax=Arthrobacter sp. PsM3 TaxID=3030531 RepID=UPI00263B576D|nr:hypothetical protein [Arthrobacter sp. PsM3]MDN4645889.1 hypothetical protein [Arthrobacter sp. PsM3]
MDIRLRLRKDPAGEPLVSATFVLTHAPAPDDRLGPLVDRATLAVDLEITTDDGGLPSSLASVTFVLLDQGDAPGQRAPLEVARQRVTGPFGHGALESVLEGPPSAALLDALVAGGSRFLVKAVADTEASGSEVFTVTAQLGGVWTHLADVADESRLFTRVDLLNYLVPMMAERIVAVSGSPGRGSTQDPSVLDALLKAARYILEPVAAPPGRPADEDSSYRLAVQYPGEQTVQIRMQHPPTPGEALETSASLASLIVPVIAHDRGKFIHLVSSGGGRLDGILPARAASGTRGPGGALMPFIAGGGRVVSVASALGSARPGAATALMLHHPGVTAHPITHHLADLELIAPAPVQRPGPVANNGAAGIWKDRWDASYWYAPEYALELPPPSDSPGPSPFTFDVEPAGGHTADGSPGITATVSVTLHARKSAPTLAEWEAAGRPVLNPVPSTGHMVQLGIPFRDERGTTQTEQISADSLSVQPGEEGTLTATFRLMDNWARLAYGALSVPDFQAQPATITVSASFEGWRQSSGQAPVIAGLHKILSLQTISAATRDAPLQLHGTALAHANVIPPWQLNAGILAEWRRSTYSWSEFAAVRTLTVSVPCSTYGTLYREATDAGKTAIGCRPALQLGQTEYKTYQEITLPAAAGRARIYRSLRSPGRFLVVPARYCVGRYGPDQDDRAYRPRLLLHSTIDVENPTNIRCVLAASLEPDLPPFVRTAITAELKNTAANPVLEYLPDAGVDPDLRWALPSDASISAVPTGAGFDVVISTDIAGFLVLKSLLERDGLRGSVGAVLPGNVRLSSSLEIGLATVTGPFDSGPIEVGPLRDGTFELTNRTGQRLSVQGLATGGVQISTLASVLAPQQSLTVDGPQTGGFDVIFDPDQTAEKLDEIRAYIEDLDLGITFVAVDDPGDAGLTGWEIQTSLLGISDAAPLVLTSSAREAERRYVLPLTAFAGDPQLQYTVTAVGVDGTRTAAPPANWPVRTQGVLIPIRRPQ